jgi:hypothetical protein
MSSSDYLLSLGSNVPRWNACCTSSGDALSKFALPLGATIATVASTDILATHSGGQGGCRPVPCLYLQASQLPQGFSPWISVVIVMHQKWVIKHYMRT